MSQTRLALTLDTLGLILNGGLRESPFCRWPFVPWQITLWLGGWVFL